MYHVFTQHHNLLNQQPTLPTNINKYFNSTEQSQIEAVPYQKYLQKTVNKFPNTQLVGLNIKRVDEIGNFINQSEQTLLNRPKIDKREKIPMLKVPYLKNEEIKKKF